MRQTTEISHVLEIFGPRNQAFRPVSWDYNPELKEAVRLAWDGQLNEAISAAQDAYITHHGNMHGVRFRVRTETKTYSFLGPWEEGTSESGADLL